MDRTNDMDKTIDMDMTNDMDSNNQLYRTDQLDWTNQSDCMSDKNGRRWTPLPLRRTFSYMNVLYLGFFPAQVKDIYSINCKMLHSLDAIINLYKEGLHFKSIESMETIFLKK